MAAKVNSKLHVDQLLMKIKNPRVLPSMQYKDYTWPHNPRTYSISYQRSMAQHKVPFGRYHLQNLGLCRRVMTGEGEFYGVGAYDEFKKLATVFYSEGPGQLIHPVWQGAKVYFVELSLKQVPRRDYVSYTFTFWEDFVGYDATLKKVVSAQTSASGGAGDAKYYTVRRGDSLWRIAQNHGLSLTRIIELNPQIKNPNLIYPGEQVRVA